MTLCSATKKPAPSSIPLKAAEVVAKAVAVADAFAACAKLHDDMTLVVMRCPGYKVAQPDAALLGGVAPFLYTEFIVVERQIHTAQLTRAIQLSQQTRHLEFTVQNMPRFSFAPGQFLSLLASKDGREITRAYSIASAPEDKPQFDLCLNRVETGFFSNLLCDMKEGDTITFHGPHGLFTLRNPLQDSLFICTGTGVAPMRGYLQWLFSDPQRAQGREFWLIYGTRHEETIYYRDDFERIAANHPQFHYLPTLSRGREDWTGLRGYVQDHARRIVESLSAERRSALHSYICGLNLMVKANRSALAELGLEKKSVMYERYD